MATENLEVLGLLYQALSTTSGLGLVVRVSDFEKAAQRLYRVRRDAGDPALDCLQFRRSPWNPETELCIVKGGLVEATPGGEPGAPERE